MELNIAFNRAEEARGYKDYIESSINSKVARFKKSINDIRVIVRGDGRHAVVTCFGTGRDGEKISSKSCSWSYQHSIDKAIDRFVRRTRNACSKKNTEKRMGATHYDFGHQDAHMAPEMAAPSDVDTYEAFHADHAGQPDTALDYAGMPIKMLLIDDDPDFCSVVEAVARKHGVEVKSYPSFFEIKADPNFPYYHGAIVDYHLESVNGFDVAQLFETVDDKLPLLMISGHRLWFTDQDHWPKNIKGFIPKTEGVMNIIQAAKNMAYH